MATRNPNPFLPSRKAGAPIQWRSGPSAGTIGFRVLSADKPLAARQDPRHDPETPAYKKDTRGRKVKPPRAAPVAPAPVIDLPAEPAEPGTNVMAGRMRSHLSSFLESHQISWGSAVDLVALAHGPVGCGTFVQARLNVPGRFQGIDGFTTLHFSTDIRAEHLEVSTTQRLADAHKEIETLFPLARGTLVLPTEPMGLLEPDAHNVVPLAPAHGKLMTTFVRYDFNRWSDHVIRQARIFDAALRAERNPISSRTDVALTFGRHATGLAWIVHKLLADLGLNVIHQFTATSAAEMARVTRCKLVIGLANTHNIPKNHLNVGGARNLAKWFSIPLLWCCFVSPAATDHSLRAVAARFGARVQRRAEALIAANRQRVETIIAAYRPHLDGKLLIQFDGLTEEELEPFRLLGMRIGDATGWQGRTVAWRKPRVSCDPKNLTDAAIDRLLAEAQPDLVLHFRRDEAEWLKRGWPTLAYSPLSAPDGRFWGYDGFALLAAELDRVINAPWRKLMKPPWPQDSG